MIEPVAKDIFPVEQRLRLNNPIVLLNGPG